MSAGLVTVSILSGGSLVAGGTWLTPTTYDETFEHDARGGPISAAFTVKDGVAVGLTLSPADHVIISSARSGAVLWSGTVAPSGAEPDGMDLRVVCDGDAMLMSDRYARLPYLVRRTSAWEEDELDRSTVNRTSTSTAADLGGTVELKHNSGIHVQGDRSRLRYTGHVGSDMTVGAFVGNVVSGITTSASTAQAIGTWKNRLFVGRPVLNNMPVNRDLSTSSSLTVAVADPSSGTQFPEGHREMSLEMRFFGLPDGSSLNDGSSPWGNQYWTQWSAVYVYGQRVDRFGVKVPMTPLPADVFNRVINPGDVMEDLVGRLPGVISPDPTLTYNPTNFGSSNPYPMYVLDYETPVPLSEVLDEVCAFQGTWGWRVTPMDPVTGLVGLQVYEWGKDETIGDYTLGAVYTIPEGVEWTTSSDDALYNRVTVQWKDARNRLQSYTKTLRSQDGYPDLESLEQYNRLRDYPTINLGEATQSRESAIRIATLVLDQMARYPRGGTVVIDRPIVNLQSGAMTPPEELRPGVMVHVAETGEKLRMTNVKVDADGVATCQVGTARMSMDQMIASVTRRRA